MDTNVLNQFPAAGATSGGSAFNIAIYTIISMLILVGIVHLLSRVMGNRRMGEWARNEFLEVIISAIIVGGLFTLMNPDTGVIIQAFNSLVPKETLMVPVFDGGRMSVAELSATGCSTRAGLITFGVLPDGTILCFAYKYLATLAGTITSLLGWIFQMNFWIDTLSKFSIDLIIIEITPLAGLSSVVQVLNSVMQSLMFLGMVVGVEMALLIFIGQTALTIFLPIGVVLRCFFGTRRVGGALIALSVGLYLVFPLALSLNAVASYGMMTADIADPLMELGEKMKALQPFGTGSTFSTTSDFTSGEKWLAYLEVLGGALASIATLLALIPQTLVKMLSALALQVTILPVLSVMITVLAIKEMAGLFGSEINLSRFEV